MFLLRQATAWLQNRGHIFIFYTHFSRWCQGWEGRCTFYTLEKCIFWNFEKCIAYNLRRFSSVVFLPQNMARADKERELSRFICIFASAGHLQNGRLKVAGAPVSGQIWKRIFIENQKIFATDNKLWSLLDLHIHSSQESILWSVCLPIPNDWPL